MKSIATDSEEREQGQREPGRVRPPVASRAVKLVLIAVFFAQALFFTFIARHRFVNGDEGFYLLASRLVLMHKRPYLDFCYVQAPLLPYVYALWMKLTAVSWMSARVFSALLTALLGTVLCDEVRHQTRNWLAAMGAVLLFATSTLVFSCFVTVHTFCLAALFVFAAYVVFSRSSAQSSTWRFAAAGFLIGLNVDSRSYLVLIAPLFLWWIARNFGGRALRASLCFVGGFVAGIAPCIYFFVASPDQFIFNNLGYHAIRSNAGLIAMWPEKLAVLLMFFLGGPQGNGVQNSILVLISAGLLFILSRRKDSPRFALQIALALGVISLLPTPVYPGYFSLCIPFLLVSAVCAANEFFLSLNSRRERVLAAAGCVALVAIYLAASVPDFRKYLITGEGIASAGRARDKAAWRLERVTEVSQAIDQIASSGEAVASFWPGYVFQSKATPLPGMENDFALPISEKLSVEQRTLYYIVSRADLEAGLAAHRPRIVVLGNENSYMKIALGDSITEFLLAHGYSLVRSIGETSIYVSRSPTSNN